MSASRQIKSAMRRLFDNHVYAKVIISPPPTTAREARFIYDNFKRIGKLDFFSFDKERRGLLTFGKELTMLYDPQGEEMKDLGYRPTFEEKEETVTHLKQYELIHKLATICALPRFSYIEEVYCKDEFTIPFKYRLNKAFWKYENKYTISPSTKTEPFSSISVSEKFADDHNWRQTDVLTDFKRGLRHNFQKFHKFDSMEFGIGPEKVNNIIGNSASDSKFGISTPQRHRETSTYTRGFTGFKKDV
ncbi:Piso0_004217 [Millerozyma farinosa CBS 7064]|uniref:Piso0_004217 protein n=1 Tax=Pichia sorbitophila (strain ATCC MYA-4447 / BCRC 22081 / CBS 7064 / NBRC 10061 / NRRL Y-12695) TaxID=559304 RepID=G8YAW9_PICSO|nr:Piso0_004217 [Millerozyma farinosa CBS 7064]CCE84664.1 Piso0_004217 [Millerozyma farinosa CBS 7064]